MPGPNAPPSSANVPWEEILRSNESWLRTVVFSRLQEAGGVDDVMQEIGLAISRQSQRGQPENIRPWLYRVAVRQCLRHRRSAGRRRRLFGRLAVEATRNGHATTEPVDWILMDERRDAVRTALKELPDLDRQVLLLKYTEGWTYQRMAEALGVSSDTIEYRLLRARNQLRRQLSRRGLVEAAYET